jgi:ribosomal protein L3
MKQLLILAILLAGCASQPLSQIDVARANREKVCATEDDTKCEEAMLKETKVITEQQNDPNYQFKRKLDEITLKNNSTNESIRLNQRLLDIQLYGVGR